MPPSGACVGGRSLGFQRGRGTMSAVRRHQDEGQVEGRGAGLGVDPAGAAGGLHVRIPASIDRRSVREAEEPKPGLRDEVGRRPREPALCTTHGAGCRDSGASVADREE
eukprot:scaffold41048_cov36-Phaeocystis_antarctica.AAC.1